MKRPSAVRLAALLAIWTLASSPAAFAQELIAWPLGTQNVLRALLPGMPVRPILPPRPLPPRPVVVPPPSPAPRPVALPPAGSRPLALSGYKVEGRVSGQAAEFVYDIVFHNPTSSRMEGVLILPIPADTVFSGFTMTVAGKEMKGELLEASQASTIYQNIVRQMQDPGLLELLGERMIRARVFPIEPGSDIRVRMTLSQVLRKSGGLYALSVPLRSARLAGAESRGEAAVEIALSAEKPIRTLYSPLDGVKIARRGDKAAAVSYRSASAAQKDLSLFYSLEEDPLAASLLTFREEGEDGFFLLSLSPKRAAEKTEIAPKDIVFIVDRSGSMEDGGKMEQAKEALKYCVSKLRDGDRFGIVDFATDSNLFQSRLVAADKANRTRALRYIDRIEAAGGTNIEAALDAGLGLLARASGRVPMVFFLTDGLPTVGQTASEALLRKAGGANASLKARLFTFGVGDDVNTLFLDKLAEGNRGDRDYVRPGETIEAKVSALYQKVDKPALTDVSVAFAGVDARQVYPRPVADIFYGADLVLLGRYKAPGKGALTVSGKAGGKETRFEYPLDFPERAGKNAFLPRLWANLKVTHELDALRLAGGGAKDPEVVESIVRLAKRYGIVTPYTSYLITEEGFDLSGARRAAAGRVQVLRAEAAGSGMGNDAALAVRAQEASSFFSRMKAAPASAVRGMALAEDEARLELKQAGRKALPTRSAGGKTFYLKDGVWTDGEYDPAAARPEKKVSYLSEDYFRLIEEKPALARYFAIGPRVLAVCDATVYRVEE